MNEFDQLALTECRRVISQMNGVVLLSDWEPAPTPLTWMLPILLDLQDTPPTETIQKLTKWLVIVNFTEDTWGKVQIHPALGEEGVKSTFEHQQFNGKPHPLWPVQNGHICTMSDIHGLASSRNANEPEPTYTIDRIIWHILRAREWIKNAASNTLVAPGDYFELPDFDTGTQSKISYLAYYENQVSFIQWYESDIYSGIAKISYFNNSVIVKGFYDPRGRKKIFEPDWGNFVSNLDKNTKQDALWIRLDKIPVLNHWQAPATMSNLVDILNDFGVNLNEVLKPSLEKIGIIGEALLLLGFPIPRKIGESAYRYHWQALTLMPKTKGVKPKALLNLIEGKLRGSSDLNWVKRSENWHPEDLQNRGRINQSLQKANVLLIGAGALGSSIAEQMVRIGVDNLVIVDNEVLEAGNLVRHSLDINSLNLNKAMAMASKLNLVNLSANVRGYAISATSSNLEFKELIQNSDLIIDATANDGVLEELSATGFKSDVPLISVSIGLNAERLFFYSDSALNFSFQNFNSWFETYRNEEHLKAQEQDLPRGISCWHPLTPARLNRISGLAGFAIELIEQVFSKQVVLPIGYCHNWTLPDLGTLKQEAAA